jgi:hypothetical protein
MSNHTWRSVFAGRKTWRANMAEELRCELVGWRELGRGEGVNAKSVLQALEAVKTAKPSSSAR